MMEEKNSIKKELVSNEEKVKSSQLLKTTNEASDKSGEYQKVKNELKFLYKELKTLKSKYYATKDVVKAEKIENKINDVRKQIYRLERKVKRLRPSKEKSELGNLKTEERFDRRKDNQTNGIKFSKKEVNQKHSTESDRKKMNQGSIEKKVHFSTNDELEIVSTRKTDPDKNVLENHQNQLKTEVEKNAIYLKAAQLDEELKSPRSPEEKSESGDKRKENLKAESNQIKMNQGSIENKVHFSTNDELEIVSTRKTDPDKNVLENHQDQLKTEAKENAILLKAALTDLENKKRRMPFIQRNVTQRGKYKELNDQIKLTAFQYGVVSGVVFPHTANNVKVPKAIITPLNKAITTFYKDLNETEPSRKKEIMDTCQSIQKYAGKELPGAFFKQHHSMDLAAIAATIETSSSHALSTVKAKMNRTSTVVKLKIDSLNSLNDRVKQGLEESSKRNSQSRQQDRPHAMNTAKETTA